MGRNNKSEEIEEFICPSCLAQELARYTMKDRIRIWRAAKHLVKFYQLSYMEQKPSEEELIDQAIEELEDEN